MVALLNEKHAYRDWFNYSYLASFLNRTQNTKLSPKEFLKANHQLADGTCELQDLGSGKTGSVSMSYTFSWLDVLPTNTFLIISCFLASCGLECTSRSFYDTLSELDELNEPETDPLVWANKSKHWVKSALKAGLLVPVALSDSAVLDKPELLRGDFSQGVEEFDTENVGSDYDCLSADSFSALRISFLEKDLLIPSSHLGALPVTYTGDLEQHGITSDLLYDSGVEYPPSLYLVSPPIEWFPSLSSYFTELLRTIEDLPKAPAPNPIANLSDIYPPTPQDLNNSPFKRLQQDLETFFPTVFINREQVSEENFSETCFYVEESNSTIYEREHRNWGETRYNQAVEQFIPVGLEDYPCWHYAELEEQDLKNPFFPELLLNAAELSLITAIQQVTNLVANIKPKPFPIVFDSNTGLFFLAGSILTPYLNETEFKELEKKHSAAMQDLVYADSDSEQPAEPKLFVSLGDEWFFRQIRNNQNQLLLFPELEGLIRS